MRSLLWWLGWHGGVPLAAAIGTGLVVMLKLEAVEGFAAGLPFIVLWIAGAMHVNATFGDLLPPAAAAARNWARQALGAEHGELFLLVGHHGSAFFVKPSRYVVFNALVVTETFVGVAEGFTLDLADRRHAPGRGTKELYYAHINGVDYRPPFFVLRSSSGETIQYESAPDTAQSAVAAVRGRLRAVSAMRA